MAAARALPNGVDTARFHGGTPTLRHLMPEHCDRFIGFVGRLSQEKGGTFFLEAARRIVAERPNTAFVLVGDGPCRADWQELAARLGIASKVVFAGVRKDMAGVYASLDALVLPSVTEALPMCLLEAMAASRPVVATNVGSVASVILPDRTGILVEPADADALANAVLRLLGDAALAQAIAARGRDHVGRHFSHETAAAAYLDLYRRALLRARRACDVN
jgi:glycosyltransferase involved in cell wall biosynthesis